MLRSISSICVVAFTAVGAPQALAQRPAASITIADSLLELDREWGRSYVTGDSAFVDRLLAPDWIGWYDDHLVDKKIALGEIRAGSPRLLEDVVEEATVRVFGSSAVIQARERVRVPDEHGAHWETRHITDVFLLRDGRWYVIASHDSVIPNP